MRIQLAIWFIFLTSSSVLIQCSNILVLFPFPSKSHHILGEALVKALVKGGHHVTMVTSFHVKEDLTNYTEVLLKNVVQWKEHSLKKIISFNSSKLDMFKAIFEVDSLSKVTLQAPEVQTLLQSNRSFDLTLLNPLISEALLGISYFYETPTVIVNAQGSTAFINQMVGNSQPYAYVPNPSQALTDQMTFLERTKNTLSSIFLYLIGIFVWIPLQDRVLHQYFPEAPPLQQLLHNVSLILLNSQFSIVETPRPYLPNMIPIGGFHIQPQTPSEDIKGFLDEAEQGVIFFSLGSNVDTKNLPQDKLEAICRTFEKFPQKFFWKFDADTLVVPENVKISKWLPQTAILAHPNTKAFITHGGLLSVTEAIYYAVPFIGIPAFADQQYNIRNAVHRRIAVELNFHELNEKTFTIALKEVLENSRYKQNIIKYSSLLHDQPIPPLDLAVHWIESILKHKGALHLQNAGLKFNSIQAYLIDVVLFLCAILIVLSLLSFLMVKMCLKYFIKAERKELFKSE